MAQPRAAADRRPAARLHRQRPGIALRVRGRCRGVDRRPSGRPGNRDAAGHRLGRGHARRAGRGIAAGTAVGDPADPEHRSRPGPGHVARQQPRAGHRGDRDAVAQPGPAAGRQSPGHGSGHGGNARRAAVGCAAARAGQRPGRRALRGQGGEGHPRRGGMAGRGRHGRHPPQRRLAGTAQPGHGQLPAPAGQHRGARGAGRGTPGDRSQPRPEGAG